MIFGIRKFKRTEQGRRLWDRIKLKIPMKIGQVVLKVTLARFSRTLSTLIAAGVDIIKHWRSPARRRGTGWSRRRWPTCERVHEGVPIATPLSENAVFPPMVSHMVKIGEETGELEKMLRRSPTSTRTVDASIQSLTSIIEPLMMIGVGLMVGVIIISMYLPMFKMLSLIK